MSQIHPAHRAVVPISDPASPYYGEKGDDPANDPPGWYTQPPECAYGQDFINTHGFIGCVPHNSPKHTLQKGAITLGALAAPVAAPIVADMAGIELTGDAIVTLARSQGAKAIDALKSLRTPEGLVKFAADRAVDFAKERAKDGVREAIGWLLRAGGIAGVHAMSRHLLNVGTEHADEQH